MLEGHLSWLLSFLSYGWAFSRDIGGLVVSREQVLRFLGASGQILITFRVKWRRKIRERFWAATTSRYFPLEPNIWSSVSIRNPTIRIDPIIRIKCGYPNL